MRKLISSELKNRLQSAIDSKKYALREYEFQVRETISIGKVEVKKVDWMSYIQVPSEINKTYMAEWKADVGSILTKDLKKNKTKLYFELILDDEHALIRKINEEDKEETDRIEAEGFVHLHIGKDRYVIIKSVDSSLSFNYRELDEDEEAAIAALIAEADIARQEPEEQAPTEVESLSLFDE